MLFQWCPSIFALEASTLGWSSGKSTTSAKAGRGGAEKHLTQRMAISQATRGDGPTVLERDTQKHTGEIGGRAGHRRLERTGGCIGQSVARALLIHRIEKV
jgi:hypothetical protein